MNTAVLNIEFTAHALLKGEVSSEKMEVVHDQASKDMIRNDIITLSQIRSKLQKRRLWKSLILIECQRRVDKLNRWHAPLTKDDLVNAKEIR